MVQREFVIQKLKELRDGMPEIKKQGVNFRDSAEFSSWRDTVAKWLKLGIPHTEDELRKFQHRLYFGVSRIRTFEEGYDYEDQSEFEKDCDQTIYLLGSAIENLEMGLVPQAPKESKPAKGRSGSKQSGVNIGHAGTVVMGDKNTVHIVDSITVLDFLNVLEKEVEAKVTDPEQKKGMLQKLREISKNPTFTTILDQGLGQILRGWFGQ